MIKAPLADAVIKTLQFAPGSAPSERSGVLRPDEAPETRRGP